MLRKVEMSFSRGGCDSGDGVILSRSVTQAYGHRSYPLISGKRKQGKQLLMQNYLLVVNRGGNNNGDNKDLYHSSGIYFVPGTGTLHV